MLDRERPSLPRTLLGYSQPTTNYQPSEHQKSQYCWPLGKKYQKKFEEK